MLNRDVVYMAIDSEREYQDKQWNPDGQSVMSIGEQILLLQEYALRARTCWSLEKDHENALSLHMLRKCAAIAVNCMEHHGAPFRDE